MGDWLPLDGAPDEIRDGRQILVCQGREQAVVRFMRSIEEGDGQWIIWRQLAAHNADGFAIRMPAPTHYKLLGPTPAVAPGEAGSRS